MEELLKNKLKAVIELKAFTKDISELSLKTEYNKVNSMIEERQQLIEKINTINARISDAKNNKSFIESNEMRALNKKIREVFVEISEIDNIIRKNINKELKGIKEKLNHPEVYIKSVNIKI